MKTRADLLADRLETGLNQMLTFGRKMSSDEWETKCKNENRSAGVLFHHVASAFPVEVDLIKVLSSGKPIEGVTWDMVDSMNGEHAEGNASCDKAETLALLKQNGLAAAEVIRGLSDAELDSASPISLNANSPLTTQYFIEDHPISHVYVHLASIKRALNGN